MYAGDSFFSLTMTGRIGLTVLSLVLAALTISAFVISACHLSRPARLLLAILVLWAFVWLSPQAYYLYYMALIDGLPLQNVVQLPPGPADIMRLLSFGGKASLAQHSQGLMGWVLILISLLPDPAVLLARFRAILGK